MYLQPPLRDFRDRNADEVHAIVNALATHEREWPENLPEQYFLLSWDNLNLSRWITIFGNWDLRTGQGEGGRLQRVRSEIRFDLETGILSLEEGEEVALKGFLHVGGGGPREFRWDANTNHYAVFNDALKQFLLLDETLYKSMLVRMLLADPEEFTEHFELVVDHTPWVRVFRVR